jgi:hypothetical protein
MNTYKVLLKIFLTAVIAYLLQAILPWWSVVIASFSISFIISTKGLSSFVGGFLGIGILWSMLAAITDFQTDSILTDRVAGIFLLPNSQILILITSIIGGLVGGLGALSGSYLRSWLMPSSVDTPN